MLNRQNHVLQALCRAQRFLEAAPLAPAERFAAVRQRLDEAVRALERSAQEQDAAHRDALARAAECRATRRALRELHIRPVVRAARACLGPKAAATAAFRMPKPNVNLEAYLAAAGGVAEAAGRHQALLATGALPDGFVQQLEATARGLRAAAVARGESIGRRARATAGLREAAAEGQRMLALLDAVLVRELQGDPERLAQWRSMSRVRRTDAAVEAEAVPKQATATTPSTSQEQVAA